MLKNFVLIDILSDVVLRICVIREIFEESGVLLWKSFLDDKSSNFDMDDI